MPNVFVNLPMPALNGAGAAADISAMGARKTVVIGGDLHTASVTLEVSADGGTTWGAVATFTKREPFRELVVVGDRMRVFVRGRLVGAPFTGKVDIGGDPAGMSAVGVALPVLNGPGVGVDATSLGTTRTIVCAGAFPGAVIRIEGSTDGGVTWGPVCQFSGKGGIATLVDVSGFFRTNVVNRSTSPAVPFSAVVSVAGAVDPQPSSGFAMLSGPTDPNASAVALPPGALVGIYLQTAADGGGVRGSMWINETGLPDGWVNTRAIGDSTLFGDGSDGDLVVAAGVTTEAGATHRYYNDGTIGATGVYRPAGRCVFFNGTLTIAAGGVIEADGGAAAGVNNGAGGGATFSVFGGTAGANGGVNAGSNGVNANGNTRTFTPGHGQGGAGGAGTAGAGGAAGVQTGTAGAEGSFRSSMVVGPSGTTGSTPGIGSASLAAGTGGGGGGGNGAASGGGSGGGGGIIFIRARKIVAPGAVPFRAVGGAGAAGLAVDTGGGGGGGGGTIVLIVRQYLGTALVSATHAAGGAGGASGGGAGVAGAAGATGIAIIETI